MEIFHQKIYATNLSEMLTSWPYLISLDYNRSVELMNCLHPSEKAA